MVSTNRPTNGYTGNIYTLYSNIRNNRNCRSDTKIGLLTLAEIKRGEITIQMIVTGTGTETFTNMQT